MCIVGKDMNKAFINYICMNILEVVYIIYVFEHARGATSAPAQDANRVELQNEVTCRQEKAQ